MASPRTNSDDIRDVARNAAIEVFRHYGLDGLPAEGGPVLDETGRFEGIVGLNGPDLRGVCVVAASEEILTEASPIRLPFDALRDWVGEVANQLAGRIKGRLRTRGLRLALSPPLVTMGSFVTSRKPDTAPLFQLSFAGGGLVVWLEFELLNGERAPSPSGQPAGESSAFDEFLFFDRESRAPSDPKRRG